jgi:hypothetical protein
MLLAGDGSRKEFDAASESTANPIKIGLFSRRVLA